MLSKVVIHRYRSCVDLTLDHLGPTVVLVGRNGSGKTNILKAIDWAARVGLRDEKARSAITANHILLEFIANQTCYSYEIDQSGYHPQAEGPFRVGLTERFRRLSGDDQFLELAVREGESVRLTDGRKFKIDPQSPLLGFLLAYLPPDDPLLISMREVATFLVGIRYEPFDEPNVSSPVNDLVRADSLNRWVTRLASPDRASDNVLFKLIHLSLTDPATLEEIQSLLGSEGLGLISDIQIGTLKQGLLFGEERSDSTEPAYYRIRFSPLQEGKATRQRYFAFSGLSLGTRRIIRMIVSMIFDKSTVMLIEHPEDGIHRGLSRQVFSRLKSYTDPAQIIATSHSELVFDMLDPSEVRLVAMVDGVTRARPLSAEEIGRARDYINESGRLSEFLEINEEM